MENLLFSEYLQNKKLKKKPYLIFTPIKNTWPTNYNNFISLVSETAILNLNGKQNRYKKFIC